MSTPDEIRRERLARRAATYTAQVARLRELRDAATADNCRCGVPIDRCKDHRTTHHHEETP